MVSVVEARNIVAVFLPPIFGDDVIIFISSLNPCLAVDVKKHQELRFTSTRLMESILETLLKL